MKSQMREIVKNYGMNKLTVVNIVVTSVTHGLHIYEDDMITQRTLGISTLSSDDD